MLIFPAIILLKFLRLVSMEANTLVPFSSSWNKIVLPSVENFGALILRSKFSVNILACPPEDDEMANFSPAYQSSFPLSTVLYAIYFPLGLQVGESSWFWLVVTWTKVVSVFLLSTETTQILVSALLSGSSVLLLTKAIFFPSGLQAGSLSSKSPKVNCVAILSPGVKV